MNHYQSLQKVLDYVGKNLDEDLSLKELSTIACISPFHFHRLFTAYTGLSLHQYVRWLRLKRAARQLVAERGMSIIEIAVSAGFESHAAFSHAFRKTCGVSPSSCRKGHGWSYWEQLPYCLPKRGTIAMKVDIRQIQPVRLAIIEHRGAPALLGETVTKIFAFAKSRGLSLKPGESYAIAYDDPDKTPAEQFRMDLGFRIPEKMKLEDTVSEKMLPGGRYATVMHVGSKKNLSDTIYRFYREWLPDSGEELADFPCIFCYHNFEHEVAESEALTECMFLLKSE